METKVFPCTGLAEKILLVSQKAANAFLEKYKIKPTLSVLLVGKDPASQIYVKKKSEACEAHSLIAQDTHLPENVSQEELESIIKKINDNSHVHGILVQCPLPSSLSTARVQNLITCAKDVDCFHPCNTGKLLQLTKEVFAQSLLPCTPSGVLEVLRANQIPIKGKHAVIVGRSPLVGKPLALMLLAHNATVTLCHSHTKNLANECSRADILVAAVGKAGLITKAHVKPKAVVIDVGINRVLANGKNKLLGDVDTPSVLGTASFLTPVPKGIGAMTIALLVRNTVRAAWLQKEGKSPI